MEGGPTGKGVREGNEPCREQERGGQGRWDLQRTERRVDNKDGLAVCACEAGLGRPFLLAPFRAPRTLDSQERFPERHGGSQLAVVDEMPLPQSQPQSDVPDSAREGAGAGRRCQKGQGMPDSNK
jgi:hypothetical protein